MMAFFLIVHLRSWLHRLSSSALAVPVPMLTVPQPSFRPCTLGSTRAGPRHSPSAVAALWRRRRPTMTSANGARRRSNPRNRRRDHGADEAEAGRDGFWLARWLLDRGVEAHVIHPVSVAVSREHQRAREPARHRAAEASVSRLAARRAENARSAARCRAGRFGPLMLARHGDAHRVDDMSLDATVQQQAGQPEAVASSFGLTSCAMMSAAVSGIDLLRAPFAEVVGALTSPQRRHRRRRMPRACSGAPQGAGSKKGLAAAPEASIGTGTASAEDESRCSHDRKCRIRKNAIMMTQTRAAE